jgi:hypothetical protein
MHPILARPDQGGSLSTSALRRVALAALSGLTAVLVAAAPAVAAEGDEEPVTPPGDSAPVAPAPVDPAPVDPAPVDPAPVDPAPVDPAPVDPAPVDPAPVDPAPVDPAPVDPAPVDPAPADPEPAVPAVRPSITVPSIRDGYGPVVVTGTARPDVSVRIFGTSIKHNRLQQIGTVTADSAGRFSFSHRIQSGFMFAARADALTSTIRKVLIRQKPGVTWRTPRAGSVSFNVTANPGQPHLLVQVQRWDAKKRIWQTMVKRHTNGRGLVSTTLTRQGSRGTLRYYRVWVGGDTQTGLLSNVSVTHEVKMR